MPEVIFSIPAIWFAVFRNADGSMSWSEYRGDKVRAALPLAGGARCVILLDWGASKKAAFKNLFCVERDGTIAWTAELPETHDSFVNVRMGDDGLVAHSWSCFMVTLDPTTGQAIRSVFTK